MNVVIMGCGRVGARLARLFDREGYDVCVVDTNPASFEKLDFDFKGRTVVGTGIDEDVLKRAGIEQADVFLAVTNLDNPNIMASQIAKLMFKVPRVVARIYDPAREDTYHDLGLETICPTTLIAQRIHQAVITNSDEPLDDHEVEPIGPNGIRDAHGALVSEPSRPAIPAMPVAGQGPLPSRPAANNNTMNSTVVQNVPVASSTGSGRQSEQINQERFDLRRFFR